MSITKRIKPEGIDDIMNQEQLERLLYWLSFVIEHGQGTVGIRIVQGEIAKVSGEVEEYIRNLNTSTDS